MSKKITDYSNTIIYKIYCKDEYITDIYVGHTTNFIKRKYGHKIACNNEKNDLKIYKIMRENGGWDNWNMIEIAKYNCKDLTEARIKENEHCNQLKATLNSCPPYVDKNNYFCSMCNLHCSAPKKYEKHLQSVKHNNLKVSKEDNITNSLKFSCDAFLYNTSNKKDFITKNRKVYECKKCNYITRNMYDYKKHTYTLKHTSDSEVIAINNFSINCDKISQQHITSPNFFICSNCNKSYKDNSGLWRHKKKCCKNSNDISNKITSELIINVLHQNKELNNLVVEQNKIIIELSKNYQNQVINSNNK